MLPSIGNEIVKAAVAQYNAEQLLTQRDRVSRAVSIYAMNWLQTDSACLKVGSCSCVLSLL